MRSRSLKAPTVALRPEVELLLCCARPQLDITKADRIRALVQEPLNWHTLLETASRHGMEPLLYWHLNATCPDAVPTARMEALHRAFHATALYNHFCTEELLTLLHLLDGHGLPALPYKGPTLAMGVYGDLALRTFSDLDLLVHERDFSRATHLLLVQGFRLHRTFDSESSFVHDTALIAVDLHRGIVPHRFHFPLDFARLWRHRQPVSIAGSTVSTLAPEDLLIVLCVQMVRDAWGDLHKPLERRYGRLLQLCDIAALLQVHPDMDWGRVLADTRHMGGQRMLFFGLRIALELLGTALPEAVRHQGQAHPMIDVLAVHVRAQWLQEADEIAATSLTPARVHFVLRERWRDRLFPYLYAGALLFEPSDKDRMFLPLPGRLAFLYYVIRPLRVVREYGLCRFFQRLKRWLIWS
jgi:hypothetical protein